MTWLTDRAAAGVLRAMPFHERLRILRQARWTAELRQISRPAVVLVARRFRTALVQAAHTQGGVA